MNGEGHIFLRDGILHQTLYTIQVSKEGSVGSFDTSTDSSPLMIPINDKSTLHIFLVNFFCVCVVRLTRESSVCMQAF